MVDEVRYEQVGAAAVLTIDRQHRRNAVDGPTAEKLGEGYRSFVADDEARVLILLLSLLQNALDKRKARRKRRLPARDWAGGW